ncbi:MAG: PAS domain-containing protein [Anaerolineae bacterium]|jgi:signal transduction histidine kinase
MDTSPCDSILGFLPCGLCVVDGKGKILDVNPALERLLGWRSSERCGQPLARYLEQEITDPTQVTYWTVALSQALAQGRTTHLNLPTDFRTGPYDEPLVSVTGVMAPWQSSSAEHSGALVVFHDSTTRKDMEGARVRFLAVLSHELGTPVANLTVAAEQLANYMEADGAKPWRLLQVIRGETERLRRLLAQFPTTLSARMEIPRPRKRLVTLRPILRQVAQAFGVRNLDCQIVVQAPQGLPFVWSDATSIKEILSKLVEHAMRYAPAGSQIVLTAKERGDEVMVLVHGQGPGVPDEEATLEPWQAGSREEPSADHVGLSIAQTQVQALDGQLWYERHPKGRVSFRFSLPRAKNILTEEREREEDYGCDHPDR